MECVKKIIYYYYYKICLILLIESIIGSLIELEIFKNYKVTSG